jgi:hypothetical protein
LKTLIHYALHKPTGAKIPIIVKAMDKDNVITDFVEYMVRRKGYTIEMLQKRWDMAQDDIIDILTRYDVPAHMRPISIMQVTDQNLLPINVAFFFEEYILAIEKKEKLKVKKIKAKFLESQTIN